MIVFKNADKQTKIIDIAEITTISMAVTFDVNMSVEQSEIILYLNDGEILTLKGGIPEYNHLRKLKGDRDYIMKIDWTYHNYNKPRLQMRPIVEKLGV